MKKKKTTFRGFENSAGFIAVNNWFHSRGWKLADFQLSSMEAMLNAKDGLLNAPTGSGKTYAVFLPLIAEYINQKGPEEKKGLKVLWITPLRALTKDIYRNLLTACSEMEIPWDIGIRTGDISSQQRQEQKKRLPDVLLITPESLHLLLAQKQSKNLLSDVHTIIVDEWHELLGSKRGIQVELALAYLRMLNKKLRVWGISATIGNLDEALKVLTGLNASEDNAVIIRSGLKKKIIAKSILPDKVETMPWAGYLGINLLDKVMPLIMKSKTTLLFTNTRSQTEIWYRYIIERYPELSGWVALHHGSLDREIRNWVEEALHNEKLKLVICTSSLDLGVDFRPVETVIQVGSPKSVARFIQRAGRSGHQPGASSYIYFVPTHSLELIEGVSLRKGIEEDKQESREPVMNAFDVLSQFMVTLATGDGFREEELYDVVKSSYSYQYINKEEWQWLLNFITTGGNVLKGYDEFRKVEKVEGRYVVNDRRIAMRHRLSIGTIVSDAVLNVKFLSGKYIGTIEEGFLSRLRPGDVFSFAGMNLEFIRIREMTAQVKKAGNRKGAIPRWVGGRIGLSSEMSEYIRHRLDDALGNSDEPEIKKIQPLLKLQQERSAVPDSTQFLIEQCVTREGYHVFFFPFEGRLVHEGMAALFAWRISRLRPVTFSLAMNDYGFELLSPDPVYIKQVLKEINLFSTDNLLDDILHSVNSTQMARRKFREIASIAGLVFQGYPGKVVRMKHVQASSSLLFDVISENEPGNLLVRQAYQEAIDRQLEEQRLRQALQRIATQEILICNTTAPSPFAFPILVDRLREQLTNEKLEDRVQKMLAQYSR